MDQYSNLQNFPFYYIFQMILFLIILAAHAEPCFLYTPLIGTQLQTSKAISDINILSS